MANNRMQLCEVNDSGEIVSRIGIAKHFNGEWYISPSWFDIASINEFFYKCFINGNGIGLTDEYSDKPLTVVYHYND